MDTKFPSHSELHSQTLHMLSSGDADQAAERVARDWQVGDVILNMYRVQAVLGEGGMGMVYKVRHRGWGIFLAVKSPKPALLSRTKGVERFEKECETWINLGLHPNVVSCYYVRRLGGIPRIFAEFIDGPNVYNWVREGKAYESEPRKVMERILQVAIQTAWGLHHAHEHNVVHRDVKPHNFLLTAGGTAKVTDFGLAEAIADQAVTTDTPPRGGMTPAFCSPEQFNHQRLDRKSDIWSWGLCLLYLFNGRVNWKMGTEAADLLKQYLANGPAADQIPTMPKEVAELLHRCFQADPNARPGTMLDVAGYLTKVYERVTGSSFPLEVPKSLDAAAPTLNNRAVSLMDLNKVEEAVRLWEEALKIEANLPEAAANLGAVLWRAGRITDEGLLRRLNEVRQNHQETLLPIYQLVQIHMERADIESALSLIGDLRRTQGERRDILEAQQRAEKLLPQGRRMLHRVEAHADAVKAVCVSPGGQYALTASEDNTICLWGLPEGDRVMEYRGHTGSVEALALSADESIVVSAGQDRSIRFWDRPSAQCQAALEAPREAGKAMAVLPDGRVLARHTNNTLAVWDRRKEDPVHVIDAHEDWINAVAASKDGRRAITGGQDKHVKIWDLEALECIRDLTGHQGAVTAVAINDNADYALTGSADRTMRLWELASGRCLRVIPGHRDAISCIALSSDARFALTGSLDHTVRLWHVPQGRCLRTFDGHAEEVTGVAMTADGQLGLSVSRDRTLILWQLGDRRPTFVAPYMLCKAQRTESALSLESDFKRALQQGRQALVEGRGAEAAQALRRARSVRGFQRHGEVVKEWVRLYVHLPRKGLVSAWEEQQLKGHEAQVHSLRVSFDGQQVLSGAADGTVRLWRLDDGNCERVMAGHTAGVKSVVLHPGGRLAWSGSEDQTIALWDVDTGVMQHQFEGVAGSVESLDISPDGQLLVSGGWDIRMWDAVRGLPLMMYEGHDSDVVTVRWTRDGRELVSGSSDQTVRVWNPLSGDCIHVLRGHEGVVRSLCTSACGRFILSAGSNIWGKPGKIRLWDRVTGEQLRLLEGHTSSIHSVCMTYDSRFAFSGSADTTVRMWDLDAGVCVRTFEEHGSPVTSLALTQDCRYLISGDAEGMIRVWLIDWDLEDRAAGEWDETMQPYLENYLLARQPFAGALPEDYLPSPDELAKILTKRGKPEWSEEDVPRMQYLLGCAGFGWVHHDIVATEAEAIANRLGRRTFFGLGRR